MGKWHEVVVLMSLSGQEHSGSPVPFSCPAQLLAAPPEGARFYFSEL